jgi:hypothetical protein
MAWATVTVESRVKTASTFRTYWLVVVCAAAERAEEVNAAANPALALPKAVDLAAHLVVALVDSLGEAAVVALDVLPATAVAVSAAAVAVPDVSPAITVDVVPFKTDVVLAVVGGATAALAAPAWDVADFSASARARRRSWLDEVCDVAVVATPVAGGDAG